MRTLIFRSTRCCSRRETPFGTVYSVPGSMRVTVHGRPCCPTEFQTFLSVLRAATRASGPSTYTLLYEIVDGSLKILPLMKAQETIFTRTSECAVVVRPTGGLTNKILRSTIKTAVCTRSNTRVFRDHQKAQEWLNRT